MKKLIDKMVDIPYNNDIKYEVIYFRLNDNRYPVKDFINDTVDNKLKAKVYRSLILLESNGRRLREPYCKYLKEGIYELRIKHSSNQIRILYFYGENNKIVLTNAFYKNTNKINKKYMDIAKSYRNNYLLEVDDYE